MASLRATSAARAELGEPSTPTQMLRGKSASSVDGLAMSTEQGASCSMTVATLPRRIPMAREPPWLPTATRSASRLRAVSSSASAGPPSSSNVSAPGASTRAWSSAVRASFSMSSSTPRRRPACMHGQRDLSNRRQDHVSVRREQASSLAKRNQAFGDSSTPMTIRSNTPYLPGKRLRRLAKDNADLRLAEAFSHRGLR